MAVGFRAAGTSAAAASGAVSPGLPAGNAAGDVNIMVAGGRSTVSPSDVSGWTTLYNDLSDGRFLYIGWRAWQSGDAAPSVGVGVTDAIIAQIAAFTGMHTTAPEHATGGAFRASSGTNIGPIVGCESPASGVVIFIGTKGDDWTGVATLSGDSLTWVEIGEPSTTLGNDAGLVWDYALTPSLLTTSNYTFTVTGGSSTANRGRAVSFKEAAAAGNTFTKAGTVVMDASAAAADQATFTETGAAAMGAVASGADASTFAESGSAVMGAVASGVDVSEFVESGAVVMGAAAAGAGTKGATYSKTGTVALAALASGLDAATLNRLGTVTLGAVASGADAVTYAEAGTVIAGMAASGASVYEETGAAAVTPRRTLMGVGT